MYGSYFRFFAIDQPIASTDQTIRRKLRPAASPGVNSFTMQLTRTVSAAARERTPNRDGTGTKKTGA